MKRRIAAILLSVLLAFSTMTVAFAASNPMLAVFNGKKAADVGVAHYDMTGALPNGIKATVNTKQKTVYMTLTDYVSTSSLFVLCPSSKGWTVFVNVIGHCSLGINKFNQLDKQYSGLGANADIALYSGSFDASLDIKDTFGTESTPLKLESDVYAVYADSFNAFRLGSGGLSVIVDMKFQTEDSYSRKVGLSNKASVINSINLTYIVRSNESHGHADSEKLTLAGSAYLNSLTEGELYSFHTIEYVKEWSGIARYSVYRGAGYCGGAYGGEYRKCEVNAINRATVRQEKLYRIEAKVVSKASSFPFATVKAEDIKNALSFDYKVGGWFPDSVGGTGFFAGIRWFDESNTAVDGKKVEAGKKYFAYVSVVPDAFWQYVKPDDLNELKPDRASKIGLDTSVGAAFEPDLVLTFEPTEAKITKQPVSVTLNKSRTVAEFTVETTGDVSGYQWQVSTDASSWTDLADKFTTGGSTLITGAKTAKLRYTYNTSYKTLYFRCKISGTVYGSAGEVYTNVVKYEYEEAKISYVAFDVSKFKLPEHKVPVDASAYGVFTPNVEIVQVRYTMFKKLLDVFETGDNIAVEIRAKATGDYKFDSEPYLTATLGSLEFTLANTIVDTDSKEALFVFAYKVPVPEGGLPYEKLKYWVNAPVTGADVSYAVYFEDPNADESEYKGGPKHKFSRASSPPVMTTDWDCPGGVFMPDTAYTVTLEIVTDDYADPGYTGNERCFNDETVVEINGETAKLEVDEDLGGKRARVTYTFAPTEKGSIISNIAFETFKWPIESRPVDEFDLTVTTPTEGVTVEEAYFANSPETYDRISEGELKAGDEFYVIVKTSIDPAYVLDDNVSATLSGTDNETVDPYGGGYYELGGYAFFAFPGKIPGAPATPPEHTHTLEYVDEVLATCTADGEVGHYVCLTCGKMFSDADGDNEVTAADLVILTSGHELGPEYHADGAAGHYRECIYCGFVGATEPHKDFDSNGVCDTCGFKINETVPSEHTHTLKVHEAVPATCTGEGRVEYYSCDVCGKLFSDAAGTVETSADKLSVPAKGHVLGSTFTADGAAGHCRKCVVCGKKDADSPHADVNSDGKCDVCGYVMATPDKPDTPDTPDTPVTPDKPDTPDTPDTPVTPEGLRGDADLNGKVNAKDARLVLRASAKLETLTGDAFANADLDGDGKLKASEARKILRYSAKLEKTL